MFDTTDLLPLFLTHGVLTTLPGWAQTLIIATVATLITFVVVKVVKMVIFAGMDRSGRIDATLNSFFQNVIGAIGWIVIGMAFLIGMGVNAAALVGGLAVGGFIIGFALQDTLGNLAAGVTLLIYRPFQVGESIEGAGVAGKVQDLGIALTQLKTWDGRMVTIPNGKMLNNPITNYTRNPTRRLDIDVGIGYDDDIDLAIRTLLETGAKDERVLQDPQPVVLVQGLGDSCVNLQFRGWMETDSGRADVAGAKSDLTKTMKVAVEEAGCSIPYPQRDIHVHEATASTNGA